MRLINKVLLPLFLLGLSPCAWAAEPGESLHFVGLYGFNWTGIGLAKAELELEQSQDHYKVHLAIESRGIVNLFTRHRSDTYAEGRRQGGAFFPRIYESRYWTKKKPRHLKLVYDAKGVITEETVEPPEDPKERPVVPHELKDGTLDPLTMFLAMRMGNTKPRVFDAKHLWQGSAEPVATKKPLMIDGREVQGFTVTRKPLAGMTEKETKKYNEGEPPISLYLTGDEIRVPYYMSAPVSIGILRGALIKQCKTWDECKIK